MILDSHKKLILVCLVIFNFACKKEKIDSLNFKDELFTNNDPNGYSLYGFGENQTNEFGSQNFGFFNKPQFIIPNVTKVFTFGESTAIIKSDSSLWVSEEGKFRKYVQIVKNADVGLNNIYFIDNRNRLYGLGSNSHGQLGRDNFGGNFDAPKYIDSDVTSVSAGKNYLMYIKNDFTLWGLGENFHLQIHPEFVSEFIYPQKAGEKIKKVICSNYFTLFIDTENNLFGMGSNHNNRFGVKDMNGINSIEKPYLIKENIEDFAIGEDFLLLLDNKGVLFGSGINSNGQLNSKPSEYYYREPIGPKIITKNVRKIAAGKAHSLILKIDGSLWSCGSNSSGQLGDGTFYQSNELIKINSKVRDIFSSSEHSLILK